MTYILSVFLTFASPGPALGAERDQLLPVFRGRVGMYSLKTTAGEVLKDEPIGALITFQPTLLWDLPTFKSRVGVHFLADLSSAFGLMPISGIGFSGYFYVFGLSSTHEQDASGTLFQKSRSGPFVVGTLTPVNTNLNRDKIQTTNESAISFSGTLIEAGLGAGYDYPLRQNLIISLELMYRYGGAQQSANTSRIEYSGIGGMVVVSSAYY